jgi:hypothetical protein
MHRLLVLGLLLLPAYSEAADSFVQAKSAVNFGGSTVSFTWDRATTTGNLLACYVWWNDVASTIVGVSDSAAGDFVDSGLGPQVVNGAHVAQMFYKENITGGANSIVTVRFTALPGTETIGCHEISGRAESGALAQKQWHAQNFAGTGKDFIASGPVTAGAGDYVFVGTHAQFGTEATAGSRFKLRTAGPNHALTESLAGDHMKAGKIVGTFTPAHNDGFITGIMIFKAR